MSKIEVSKWVCVHCDYVNEEVLKIEDELYNYITKNQ
jgi:hypothetical protein